MNKAIQLKTGAIRSLVILTMITLCGLFLCSGCTPGGDQKNTSEDKQETPEVVSDKAVVQKDESQTEASQPDSAVKPEEKTPEAKTADAEALRTQLGITEDYRPSFVHGDKGASFQKYIVLHDTEGESDPLSVVNSWDNNGNLVAAHFIVGKDGSIVQCVPLDKIAHHAGYGDTGHDALFGVEDESRDDKVGTVPIGDWAADYGMNSYSVGIEMVHVGGSGEYPEAQLEALDKLIAYIDAYYGTKCDITDHKAWRTGNSDTSAEFATYLANYQTYRTHLAS